MGGKNPGNFSKNPRKKRDWGRRDQEAIVSPPVLISSQGNGLKMSTALDREVGKWRQPGIRNIRELSFFLFFTFGRDVGVQSFPRPWEKQQSGHDGKWLLGLNVGEQWIVVGTTMTWGHAPPSGAIWLSIHLTAVSWESKLCSHASGFSRKVIIWIFFLKQEIIWFLKCLNFKNIHRSSKNTSVG